MGVFFLQQEEYTLSEITLERQQLGFGFRIVGGTEEGSQVTVGHIVPGGAADGNQRIATGDEILSIDGHNVVSFEFMMFFFLNLFYVDVCTEMKHLNKFLFVYQN